MLFRSPQAYNKVEVAHNKAGYPMLVVYLNTALGWKVIINGSGATDGKIKFFLFDHTRLRTDDKYYTDLLDGDRLKSENRQTILGQEILKGNARACLMLILLDSNRMMQAANALGKKSDADDKTYGDAFNQTTTRPLKRYLGYSIPRFSVFCAEEMVARGDHAGALDLLVKDLTRYQQGDAEPRELLLACRARIQCAQIRGFISSSQITPELLADADSGVARAARGKQETLLWVEQLRQLAA